MTNNEYTTPGSPTAYGEVWASMFRPLNSFEPMTAEDASYILGGLADTLGHREDHVLEDLDMGDAPEHTLFLALVRLGVTAAQMTVEDLRAAHAEFNRRTGIDGDAAND